MRLALTEARRALEAGEVPIGAVLVLDDSAVAQGYNQPIRTSDPTAHAEIVVLRQAAASVGNYRLPGSALYVTVEPCLMCVGAMIQARVQTLVYGAAEPRWGAVQSITHALDLPQHNHRIDVIGEVLEPECRALMQDFFRARR